jgi:multicomponent Na+:H+ antiporter subunit B
MKTPILKTTSRMLVTLLVTYSLFLLLRGHNEPGGGFIGGLVTSATWVLFAIAFGVHEARASLRIDPKVLIGLGLLIAIASALPGLLREGVFMKGYWADHPFFYAIQLGMGTPFLFDIGVYLVVVGATLTTLFALKEEEPNP